MRSKNKTSRDLMVLQPSTLLGIAWYHPEQWQKLLKISVDRESLHDTYAEWLANVTQKMIELAQMGYAVRAVVVDVDDLVRWCNQHGCTVNGTARSQFVVEKLQHSEHNRDEKTR